MAKDKYELYRVPIHGNIDFSYCSHSGARLCCKYILNDIKAEELILLLETINIWKRAIKSSISHIVTVDNMSTEQLVYLYIAIYSYALSGYEYTAPRKQMPISMLLDKELINKIISELYLNIGYETIWSAKTQELVERYPIMGPKKKFNQHGDNVRFLIFADMWSRATNQVMSFDLYTMLEGEKG